MRKRLKGLHRLDDAEDYIEAVEQNAQELRDRVLKYIMVRRTRREIEEFYGEDLKKQKIWFPKVNDPVPLLYQLNRDGKRSLHQNAGKHHQLRFPLRPLSAVESALLHRADRRTGGAGPAKPGDLHENLAGEATGKQLPCISRKRSRRFIKSHELVLKAFDDGFVYTSKKHSRKVLEYLEDGDDDAIEASHSGRKKPRGSLSEFHAGFPTACRIGS